MVIRPWTLYDESGEVRRLYIINCHDDLEVHLAPEVTGRCQILCFQITNGWYSITKIHFEVSIASRKEHREVQPLGD